MDIKEIKRKGKEAFKANYWSSVIVAFVLGLLSMGTTYYSSSNIKGETQELKAQMSNLTPAEVAAVIAVVSGIITLVVVVSLVLKIFLFNPLKVGAYRFFRLNTEDASVGAGTLTEGFGDYGHTFFTLFLRDLFLVLWTMLLIIPGIVKAYSYMLIPYLIKDDPELSAAETITRSRQLMNGYKWKAFVMDLSFLGWAILGAITFNLVNIFWTNPYRENARARFYLEVLNNNNTTV